MSEKIQQHIHLDDDWMWRFSFLDAGGAVIATSQIAYFTQAEAKAAMSFLRNDLGTVLKWDASRRGGATEISLPSD
ncbi:MAG TPA: hypothetical protein VGB59_06910 [Allosphingosinicella sp.]|jgi:uncharacterized protein YegP (UPF0339 family)